MGANLTFPDMVDLARTIKKEQTEAGNGLREKDGWRGPVGLGGGNQRNLLHNVRFWWRPKGGDRPARFRHDYSLNQWLKTVLLFERGEITILLRDAPMTAACPTTEEDAEAQGENKYLILARPPLRVAGAMHPRSTYKGERQPEGQSKKRTAFGAYTGGRVPAVPVFVDSKVEEPFSPQARPRSRHEA